jgi:Domain of unknown function (DUF4394)/RTX calcium-binding nonapeptide repeat (4 copies)
MSTGISINGTNFNDSLLGGVGNDTILALNGEDSVNGGDGNDSIFGDFSAAFPFASGDDYLFGGQGNDTIFGDDGNDVLDGFTDNDVLIGGNGLDFVLGGDGNDTLFGFFGNDTLLGANGNDVLLGEVGDDTLDGGNGADILTGGLGRDVYLYGTRTEAGVVDTIASFSSQDVIRVAGGNFSAASFSTGDGSTVGLNQVQINAAGNGLTTVSIGTDNVAGADVVVQLLGTIGTSYFAAAGTDITLRPLEFIALAPNNLLYRFFGDSDSPADSIQLTGLTGNLIGIDFRPADRLLYGLTSDSKIVRIDTDDFDVHEVATLQRAFVGGDFAGVDFNPTVDRLRVVGSNGSNTRVNVDTGAVTVDGSLAYVAGDANAGRTPSVTAIGYINNRAGQTTTTLFDIDSTNRALSAQNPPNDGGLATRGGTGIAATVTGFDILTSPQGDNLGYGVASNLLIRFDTNTGGGDVVSGLVNVVGTLLDVAFVPI